MWSKEAYFTFLMGELGIAPRLVKWERLPAYDRPTPGEGYGFTEKYDLKLTQVATALQADDFSRVFALVRRLRMEDESDRKALQTLVDDENWTVTAESRGFSAEEAMAIRGIAGQVIAPSEKDGWTGLGHGDMWSANIMCKMTEPYGRGSGRVYSDFRIIDWEGAYVDWRRGERREDEKVEMHVDAVRLLSNLKSEAFESVAEKVVQGATRGLLLHDEGWARSITDATYEQLPAMLGRPPAR